MLAVLLAGAGSGCEVQASVPRVATPTPGTTTPAAPQRALAEGAPTPSATGSSPSAATPSSAGSAPDTPSPSSTGLPTASGTGADQAAPVAELLGIPDLSALLDPVPEPEVLTPLLDEALDLRHGTMSAVVMDRLTGELLYDRSAGEAAVPASAVKVLTAVAALEVLGPDHRYTTSAVALPAKGGGTAVVLDAGGDVMLGTGANGTEANGRAGLGTLAERTATALQERGTTGAVSVRLDDSGYTGPGTSPAWSPDIVPSGNASTVQPLATYGGRAAPSRSTDRLEDPAASAAEVFRGHLAAHVERLGLDIVVADDVTREELDGRGSVLAGVESAPVAEQVAYMLQTSDNQVAETTGRNLALAVGRPGSFDGAARAIEEAVAGLGVDAEGLELVDASGLSGENRVSAAQLAGVLQAATADPRLAAAVEGLPVAGQDGTLQDRMAGTTAEGTVRAKTGSLNSVTSLTGTVETEDGRELLFSFVANDQPGGLAESRLAVDRAAVVLADCGCRED